MALTQSDAAHFCRRIGFAGTTDELNHFIGREVEDVVNEVLGIEPPLPSEPSFLGAVQWWTVLTELREWWYQRMVDATWIRPSGATMPSPLVEKLTLFWHGHFSCGIEKVQDHRATWRQNNIFREHCMGDFETMVQQVSVSGSMLKYLDNADNVVGKEQENFARELMELHTTGVGKYTETDIVEVAKAWTGHGIVGWTGSRWDTSYVFTSSDHDYSNKTIFGITRNWDGPEVVTELVKGVKRMDTARFIAGKMWRFFVNDHPSEEVLDALQVQFAGYMNIKDLLRAIFTHPEFWDPINHYALVRTPTEFVVDIFRRTGIEVTDSGVSWLMDSAGQELYEPPNVAGWGSNGFWLSTAMTWGKGAILRHFRWNMTVRELFGDLRHMEDPDDAVAFIINTLGIPEPSEATVTALRNWYVSTKQNDAWSIKSNALVMGALTPEFQLA